MCHVTRLILLALSMMSASASGAAGDVYIGNQNSGKNVNFFTNNAGTSTVEGVIDPFGQWTMGSSVVAAGGININTFKSGGRTAVITAGPSTATNFVGDYIIQTTSGTVGGLTTWRMSFDNGFYFGSPGNLVFSNDNNTVGQGGMGSVTPAGAWTLGVPGVTNTLNGTTYIGGSQAVTVNNPRMSAGVNAIPASVASTVATTAMTGILTVINVTDGSVCTWVIRGVNAQANLMSDPPGVGCTSNDTGTTMSVFYTTNYFFRNRYATTKTFSIQFVGVGGNE